MADISRQSSPRITATSSASPSRPSPLSRPHWPYTTYTHRSSSSAASIHSSSSAYMPRSSTPSSLLSPGVIGTPVRRSSNISNSPNATGSNEDSMRHWSFTAFEWVVRDVHKLRDFVENPEIHLESEDFDATSDPASAAFDILKESPTVIGDGKFKLEIARTPIVESSSPATPVIRMQPPTLSLYITSVMLEYAHTDYEIYTSMFAAIKCQDDRVGERGARADWAWEYWQNDWIFREDSEVWECPLPPLSTLLENPRIKETDSFVICVQVHSPVGPFFPQQPSASYVPRDLLDGLEASLDNANTGDVQFICLERQEAHHLPEEVLASPSTETQSNRQSSSPSSNSSTATRAVARKRIIYAHSDILTRRSEYFATMLNSSFAENALGSGTLGERKTYTIVVEEADFNTIYWLLKWVYANWLLFKEQDDPKAAVEGVGAGWSVKFLKTSGAADEWEWKAFSKSISFDSPLEIDARSIGSAESVRSIGRKSSVGKAEQVAGSLGPPSPSASTVRTSNATGARTPSSSKSSNATRPPPSPTRRSTRAPSTPGNPAVLTIPMSDTTSSVRRASKPVPIPVSPTTSTYPAGASHYPLSPRTPRQRSRPTPTGTVDPHPHPTPPPPPASALSMYQVAHRYAMPGLAALALEHMMSTITPQSSFALLLATSAWEELHALVEDYVVEKWDEVSVSSEFEQCCQEVAGGEWGPEGGKTMMALFRRLRSPSSMSYARA